MDLTLDSVSEKGTSAKTVSFRDFANSNYGDVLRASAFFYYFYSKERTTTISFMNYWKHKRDLDVTVVGSLRDLSGRLLQRVRLEFDQGEVINWRPRVNGREDFCGSVEVEVFSTRNLVIPYAAIVASYETKDGLSLVHSYGRSYSNHEMEEGRTICDGQEGCWTLRDSRSVRSFCVIHNGSRPQPSQVVNIRVSNHKGESLSSEISWPDLNPFETKVVYPGDVFPNLVEFLEGKEGYGTLNFTITGFTRMLVGNERRDGSDLQVTHSNFNYSEKPLDFMNDVEDRGYMRVPDCGVSNKHVTVYPNAAPGNYALMLDREQMGFSYDRGLHLPIRRHQQSALEFRRESGVLPTRIVTAIVLESNSGHIPNECSLGVITHLQPKKRMWWGPCLVGRRSDTKIILHDLPEVYGGIPDNVNISVRLYSGRRHGFLEKIFSASDLARFDEGISVRDIFSDAEEYLGSDFGYYTVYSEYGGLTSYSLLENEGGSRCLEHGF